MASFGFERCRFTGGARSTTPSWRFLLSGRAFGLPDVHARGQDGGQWKALDAMVADS